MKTLQFLIDNICADFTVVSLLGVVRTCVARGPCTINDVTQAILQRDRSLDIRCAEGLAEGAVQAMSDSGELEIRDSKIYAAESAAGRIT